MAGSETPVHPFKNTFFNRTFPVAACDSFRFPACSFIKKGTPAKTFFCEICKIKKKKFFTSAFQVLNTKTRRSYSGAFIYIISLKIICE